MAKRLTLFILIGMVLGILTGFVLHNTLADEAQMKEVAGYFSVVTDIFLRLIKMIIAPLVFATLVSGIAHMGDGAALGRIGGRVILWFIAASAVSLTLGLLTVNFFEPGVGLNLPLPPADAVAPGVETAKLTLKEFIVALVPKSIFEAMANNTILQIVVFSVFFGIALAAVGEEAKPIVRGVEALVHVMLKVTGYVMQVSPLAVFAAISAVVTVQGLGVLLTFGEFILEFYAALVVLWLLIIAAGALVIGKRMGLLVRYIREPLLLAFSTASSEAAYPKTLEQLDKFGVPNRISSFVLPLGYSFNLDGSMMYCAFATIFIAQAYGIDLTVGQQMTMLLLLMVTSKGMAAVPRASLVVIAATLHFFGIPEAGLLLILGIDQFLDMGRSATNVVGNAVATAVVAKWEGELGEPLPEGEPVPLT